MKSPTVTTIVCAVGLSFLSGCGSVYFYDEGRKKTGKEAVVSFEKVETSALFDRAAKDVNDHLAVQQASVKRLASAAQNLQMVSLISGQEDPARLQAGTGTGAATASARLAWLTKNRLDRIVGTEAAGALIIRDDLEALRTIQSHVVVRAASLAQDVYRFRSLYKKVNGAAENTCVKPINKPMDATPPVADPASIQRYRSLLTACKNLKRALELEGLNDGHVNPISTFDKAAEFGKISEKHKLLKKAKANLADIKKALKRKIDELEKKYKETLNAVKKHPKSADAQQEFKEAAEAVKKFFKDLQNIQEKGDGFTQKIEDAAKKSGLKIDLTAIKALTGVSGDFIGQMLSAEILGTNLNSLLDAALDPDKAPAGEKGKIAQSYLLKTVQAIDIIARLSDAVNAPEKVPSPNALYIALGYQRYLQENAKVSEAKIKGEISAAGAQEQALLEEVYYLWSAHRNAKAMDGVSCGKNATGFAQYVDQCAKKNPNASNAAFQALRHYDTAWTRGLIVKTTASIAASGLNQQFAVEKARQNAKAWFDILKPAIDELAAYGAGGIKPGTISSLIQALGLSYIGLGVN